MRTESHGRQAPAETQTEAHAGSDTEAPTKAHTEAKSAALAPNSPSEPATSFASHNSSLVQRLYERADAARWQLSCDQFAEALHRSAGKRFPGRDPAAGELAEYLNALELEDLALACACAAGLDAAWEFFVARYRPDLRAAARATLRASGSAGEARAEELADSLYAELYGIAADGGARKKSLFEYFHGRSKLGTWLRSVLAQRHVDALRAGRRNVPLDDAVEEHPRRPPLRPAEPDRDRRRYLALFDGALTAALAELDSRDRLRLALFYLDRRTMAEIGKSLREHESTVSRQLDRTRRRLRERVTELLARPSVAPAGAPALDVAGSSAGGPGLDAAQIELACQYALEDSPFDLSRALDGAESRGGTEIGFEGETP